MIFGFPRKLMKEIASTHFRVKYILSNRGGKYRKSSYPKPPVAIAQMTSVVLCFVYLVSLFSGVAISARFWTVKISFDFFWYQTSVINNCALILVK